MEEGQGLTRTSFASPAHHLLWDAAEPIEPERLSEEDLRFLETHQANCCPELRSKAAARLRWLEERMGK